MVHRLLKAVAMIRGALFAWFVVAAACAVACTGTISDSASDRGDPGRGGVDPAADGPTGDPLGSSGAALSCKDPDAPGPRLLRLLTRDEYARTVADVLGVARPAVDEIPVEPKVAGYDNNAAASVITTRHVDAYLSTAERVVRKALETSRARIVSCDPTTAPCAKQLVEGLGLRLFRRPLTAEESTRYQRMFAADLTGGAADEGVVLALSAMMVSPNFLYRSEIGEPTGDGTFALGPYEIATALSYTFWGTTPDATLLDAAGKGGLADATGIEAQARRLLEDPKARPQIARFFGQWLDSGALLSANKDKQIYPSFTDAIREGLAAEEAAFVDHVVFDSTKTFGELLVADYVFANDAVAGFYGLPTGIGATPKKVPGGAQRGGLLTLGSVLASQAHANESSPIKRGKWVRDRLLCQELPTPPPSVDATPPGLDPALTTRERFAKHTADPSCASCHQFIDGVGFAFERYDGVGAHRATENGKPIDASGEIRGREGLDTGTKEAFEGPRELAALLAKSERAPRCFAHQWFRYARGLKEQGPDACAARTLAKAFLDGGQSIPDLLVKVVTQRSFLVRRGEVSTVGGGS
jgi:hypothetical protein